MSSAQFVEMAKTTSRERGAFARTHLVTGGCVPATSRPRSTASPEPRLASSWHPVATSR
jgi:hypothetical protein